MDTTVISNKAKTAQKEREPIRLLKRIGSTTFEVAVHFSDDNAEKLEEKVLRLIEREVSNIA